MKRKAFIALLVLLLALQPLAASVMAVDVNSPVAPSAWAQFDVENAIHTGLVPEALQTKYRQNTTRAEFCALAVTLYEKVTGAAIGAEVIEGVTFTDTDDSNIRKMAAVKVVSGVGDGKFAPNGLLTREQAAIVLAQLAAALDKPLPEQMPSFRDNARISDWARFAVGQVQAGGIMGGVGNNAFAPRDLYTKEQSIVTMLYLFDWVKPEYSATGPTAEVALYPMSAAVNGQYLWGYVDKSGAFVISPQYAYASEWNGEYGIVSYPDAPGECSVIDRSEARVAFACEGREPMDTFPLAFEDGMPNVFFVGNCVMVETDLFTGIGECPLFSLTDRKYVTSILFDSYSDGMICGHAARGDRAVAFDADGRNSFGGYSMFGAFYEGVAMSWGRLFNKQGEVVSDVNLMAREDILVAGLGKNTDVGDFCIFAPSKWSQDGELTPLRGVIRADGTVILPAEYTYVRLTECKQILTGKPGETYRLRDTTGYDIFEFPTYMSGALLYNGNGYYMYKSTDGDVVVMTTHGAFIAKIEIAAGARYEFVSGIIRVTAANGFCTYYTVSGNPIFASTVSAQ